jgi:hypothetical protein
MFHATHVSGVTLEEPFLAPSIPNMNDVLMSMVVVDAKR